MIHSLEQSQLFLQHLWSHFAGSRWRGSRHSLSLPCLSQLSVDLHQPLLQHTNSSVLSDKEYHRHVIIQDGTLSSVTSAQYQRHYKVKGAKHHEI